MMQLMQVRGTGGIRKREREKELTEVSEGECGGL